MRRATLTGQHVAHARELARRRSVTPHPVHRGFLERSLRALGAIRQGFGKARREMVMPLSEITELGPVGGAQIWKAAEIGRLSVDWVTAVMTADQELRGNLRRLRGRARALGRNNPWVRRYLGLLGAQIIGPTGSRLHALIVGPDGVKIDRKAKRTVERAWTDWQKRENCTTAGNMTFPELSRLQLRTTAREGDSFARKWRGFPGNRWKYALEPIDPDQVNEERNQERGPNRPLTRMGIELDEFRRPIGYYVGAERELISSGELTGERIPADQILHSFLADRVNQTRGFPWIVTVMYALQQMAGYSEAELIAARSAAAKMGFFTRTGEEVQDETLLTGEEQPLQVDATPGTMEELPPGVSFTPWDPQHPAAAFADFMIAQLREASAGLEVGYAPLSNDLGQTSYSSQRIGVLNERDQYRVIQSWWDSTWTERVYHDWLDWQILNRTLDLPMRDLDALHEALWVPRGWPWFDPLKDAQAAKLLIGLGLESRTALLSGMQRDFEEIVLQLSAENEFAEDNDVDISGVEIPPGLDTSSDPEEAANDKTGAGDAAAAKKNGKGRHVPRPELAAALAGERSSAS